MKKLVSLLLALTIVLSMSAFAYAEATDVPEQPGIVSSEDGGENTRAEETTWYYRRVNGEIQARLWSNTYGYWKTDWITIGYYDP